MAFLFACSSSNEMTVETPPPNQSQQWTARVIAENADIVAVDDALENGDDETRAVFIGGNNGNRFVKCWDSGDIVYVYKGETLVGTMSPDQADWGFESGTLQGTLTGPFSVNDVLTLYCPSKAMTLTGQTGQIQSQSEKSYRQATATVTQASDNILSLSSVVMSERITYGRFFLTDEITGSRLHPSQLVIHAITGPDPVLSTDENGTPTERGDFVINCVLSDGEYPGEIFVSMYKETEAFQYTLKATVGEDIYVGPLVGQNPIQSQSSLGGFMNYRRKMRKATAMGNEAITVAAISSKVFTGSAIVPEAAEIVVKDGEETLVLDTDYSIAYSDNTGAGTATVTITGLADKYAQAQTKYLGTKVVSFTIEKATPVVTLSSTTAMTLEQDTKQTRTAATVTIGGLDLLTDATYHGTVTYTSDDPSIASVNATTGEVTGVATGTTTITATVASAANWNAASASYTVKVSPRVNANETSPWTVTEDEENGEVYQ